MLYDLLEYAILTRRLSVQLWQPVYHDKPVFIIPPIIISREQKVSHGLNIFSIVSAENPLANL